VKKRLVKKNRKWEVRKNNRNKKYLAEILKNLKTGFERTK